MSESGGGGSACWAQRLTEIGACEGTRGLDICFRTWGNGSMEEERGETRERYSAPEPLSIPLNSQQYTSLSRNFNDVVIAPSAKMKK